jgi:hypothetical protein
MHLSHAPPPLTFPVDSSSYPLLSALRVAVASTLQSTSIYDSQYFASALVTDENRLLTSSLDTVTILVGSVITKLYNK